MPLQKFNEFTLNETGNIFPIVLFEQYTEELLNEFLIHDKKLKLDVSDEKVVLSSGQTKDGRKIFTSSIGDNQNLVLLKTGRKGLFSGGGYMVGIFHVSLEDIKKEMPIGSNITILDDGSSYSAEIIGYYPAKVSGLHDIADKTKEKEVVYGVN